MNDDRFPPDATAGIVEHMNDDHADAVLAIARAFGDLPDATSARLVDITPCALELETTGSDDPVRTRVAFDPPIESLDAVRARLVAMTKAARAALVDGDPIDARATAHRT